MTINCDDFKPKAVPAGTATCKGDCRCCHDNPTDDTCASNDRICAFCCSERFCRSDFQKMQVRRGAADDRPGWMHSCDHHVGVHVSSF